MNTIFSSKYSTYVGLGFGLHSDLFQSGREAAQMAKSQIQDLSPNLVLAFGPNNNNFQDFIEGVRIVTGESTLVGLPVERVFSDELFSPQACFVCIFHTNTSHFSLASASLKTKDYLAPITSLFSQFRMSRGNRIHQFDHRGILLFDNNGISDDPQFSQMLLAESGLESWMVRTKAVTHGSIPLLCKDQVQEQGIVGIEFLSHQSWGLGVVDISRFKKQKNIYKESVKTALRDALNQMKGPTPSMGILFFNFPIDHLAPEDFRAIFKSGQEIVKDMPLIGLVTHQFHVHWNSRADFHQKDSVIALLAPQ